MQRYDLQFTILGILEHTNIRPVNIMEIGSRDGHDCKYLLQQFSLSDTDGYIFEANPVAAETIVRTYPSINTYNYGVASTRGTMEFNVEPENIGASSLLQRVKPTEGMKTVTINTIPMSDFFESTELEEISIAKIDVEGMTLDVLKSFGEHLHKLKSIQLEMEHEEVWKGQSLYPEIKEWLEQQGYVQVFFVLLRQIQSDSFWVRKEYLL